VGCCSETTGAVGVGRLVTCQNGAGNGSAVSNESVVANKDAVASQRMVSNDRGGRRMTEGAGSEVGSVGRGGSVHSRVGRPPVQPGGARRDLGVGGAEQSRSTDGAERAARTARGLPRLAGRTKRRRKRAGRGRPRPVCYEAVLRLDAELCEASKGVARLRLELGQALDALVEKNGTAELGYSSLYCYALQRCSQTGRWADDTRRVAVRLGSLPALRAALVRGEVNFSMAELVSRHATAETDAQLAEQAKGLTVRQMRERLAPSAHGEQGDEPERQGQQRACKSEPEWEDAAGPESAGEGSRQCRDTAKPVGGARGEGLHTTERVAETNRERLPTAKAAEGNVAQGAGAAGIAGGDRGGKEPPGDREGDGAAGRQQLDGEACSRGQDEAAGGREGGAAAGGRGHDRAADSRGQDAAARGEENEEGAGPDVAAPGESEFVTVELGDWAPFPYVDEIDPIRTLTITLDRDVAWLFESTRMLVELLVGQSNADSLLECLLAEALTSLPGERARGCALYEQYAQEQARQRTQLEQQARWVQESEARCEKNFAALLGLGGGQAGSPGRREPETSCAAPLGQQPGHEATGEAKPKMSCAAPLGMEPGQQAASEAEAAHTFPAPSEGEVGQQSTSEADPGRSWSAPPEADGARAVVIGEEDPEASSPVALEQHRAQAAFTAEGETGKNFLAPLGCGEQQGAPTAERDAETNPLAGIKRGEEQEAPSGEDQADSKRREPRQLDSIPELDRCIGELAAKLAGWDLHVGMLADKLHQAEGWRRLGFSTETQYARERLGMCASSLRAKRALARQLRTLPRVREALEQGAIGFDAAVQIGKVATERTEKLWLDRAKRRTAKHLREEVELCELVMRRIGRRGCLPPTEEQMRQYFEVERAITSGRALVDALVAHQEGGSGEAQTEQDTGGSVEGDAASSGIGVADEQQRAAGTDRAVNTQPDSEAESDADAAGATQRQMSGSGSAPSTGDSTPERPNCRRGGHSRLVGMAAVVRAYLGLGGDNSGPAGAFDELAAAMYDCPVPEVGRLKGIGGRVTLRLRVRQSTACYYRLVEREARRWLPPDVSFMEYACLAMWAGWCHTLDRQVAYAHIYARDRHRCTCPVCTRREVTPHHVRFRSRGGDDSDENVTSPCSTCHLGLIHGGVITVQGPATRLSWAIGRDGGLRVVGREKVSE
jgi:hypothetical protein